MELAEALARRRMVRRYDPDGTLTQVVELPCRNVSSCTFGGVDGSTLYITTSRDGRPKGEVEPEAGSVFAFDAGVRGDPIVLQRELDLALGRAWDDELEPFRYAGDGAPVRWLHRVG